MSTYADISGMQNLRQMSQTAGASDFKTYVEQKAHEVQNDVADVVTGLGNEVMGHALLKTLEHVGKAKKALKDAAKKTLNDAQGKVTNEVSDFADRASGAIQDAQGGVRAAVRDGGQQVEDLFSDARTANPFGSGRIVLNDDGTARIAASTEQEPEAAPEQAAQPPDEERPAPAQPAPVEDEVTEQAGDNLGSDLAKGTETIAKEAGEKVAVKAGEDVGEQSLKGAFLSSLGEDESPFGLAATAALGVATLIAGIVSHHHEKPPVAVTRYTNTQPINYSYQSGLN